MKHAGWTAIVSVAALSFGGLQGCGPGNRADQAAVEESGPPPGAIATLRTAAGGPAGTASAAEESGALSLTLRLEGLPPGVHGVHVHTVGKCDGPKFESAGSHWNPADKQHGLKNPQGHHAGDMPNLTIAADGGGTLTYLLRGATMAGLLDGDGSAMVVHAAADDQKTDPSGNSGDRIACGVFTRP